ncbi:cholecystokinin receptor-like [Dreissena polymorpha]|uniref:G-protein coupled receptors family 1 profile domain-containing protein n=1 Tax=Dreissena polymorpha TaxID=45954 RepID=A0A9D3Z6S5_DREPO|nr:cholecystokinin receptor-like [Dreissena polymorpha]KAH3711269.1 hypothetical protein DPMN_070772 [Dreissena polymorpha]
MENMSAATMDAELLRLNDAKAELMTPVVAFLSVLMSCGVLGNVMVCCFYGSRARRSSHGTFISTVAMYDLIICGLSIPMEIVDLRLFYTFTNVAACKAGRFINHFGAIGSVHVLLVIAVDRYRRICKPVKKQLSLKQAKIACACSLLVSVFFSWPSILFYTPVAVDVKNDFGLNITGHDCTTTRDTSFNMYISVFNYVYMTCFISYTFVLCVMYTLVGRVIVKHNKTRKSLIKKQESSTSKLTSLETSLSNGDQNISSSIPGKYRKIDADRLKNTQTRPRTRTISTTTDRRKSTLSETQEIKNLNFSVIMLTITGLFVLSFLPFLVLSIWRAVNGEYEPDVLSDAKLVAFQFGLRSYFLNSALNPFVYGVLNSKFRSFVYRCFCGCSSKIDNLHAPSTSDAS